MNGEALIRRAIGTAAIGLAIVVCACGESKSPTAPSTSTSPPAVSTPTTPPAVAPTLASISPGALVAGASGTITFTGTGFVAGSTISVGGRGVVVQDVTLVNSTSITARLTIEPSADIGARPVTVTTNGGTTAEQPLTINAMAPSVTSMTMTGAARPGDTVDVTLRGTGFVPGATTVSISGTGVSVVSVNATAAVDQITTQDVQSGPMVASNLTTLTIRVAIDRNAAPGPRTLTVTTPGGTSTFTFAVATPLPTIGSFGASPVIIQRGRSATLSWSDVTNATRCEINIGIGVVPCANGRVDVTPDITTEYMFSATGPGGREWTYTTVVVEGPPGAGSQTFEYAGSTVQTFTVPVGITRVTITAIGAGGGGSGSLVCLNPGSTGGAGARITGTFAVQPSSQLRVIVGGAGERGGDGRGAGGGGGSFVFTSGGTLQIAAGGGGGAGARNGGNGTFSETGGPNSSGDPGGALGAGGASGGLESGGGGGGVVSAGADATGGPARGGGVTSAASGGAGGVGGVVGGGGTADGGFGSGGGGGGTAGGGGGGGGGYSGGRSGSMVGAGGGGSFNVGSDPAATVGAPGGAAGGPGGAFCLAPTRGGHGSVIIVWQ